MCFGFVHHSKGGDKSIFKILMEVQKFPIDSGCQVKPWGYKIMPCDDRLKSPWDSSEQQNKKEQMKHKGA